MVSLLGFLLSGTARGGRASGAAVGVPSPSRARSHEANPRQRARDVATPARDLLLVSFTMLSFRLALPLDGLPRPAPSESCGPIWLRPGRERQSSGAPCPTSPMGSK